VDIHSGHAVNLDLIQFLCQNTIFITIAESLYYMPSSQHYGKQHYKLSIGTLFSLAFLNNSKTVVPSSSATLISKIGFIQILYNKLQEVLSLCKIYFSKSNTLQPDLGGVLPILRPSVFYLFAGLC
jgi:hypothetical protein